jgi:tetratricopeptide (TPR) repeat protein
MTGRQTFTWCVLSFVFGASVAVGLAQGRRPSYTPEVVTGKTPHAAAEALLDGALTLAGSGSWERLAVGRAWYLGGDKAKGQQIIDGVTSGRRVAASDWRRIGRIYAEAREWERAADAYDKSLAADDDEDVMLEYGATANVFGNRDKAEELINRAMREDPREFWYWVNAGGSYLGVTPQ